MKVQGNAFYTYTRQPDTKFEPMWKVQLQMTDDEAKKLKDVGLKVKRNDDGIYEYKFARRVEKRTGGQNQPPRVVDAAKNPIDIIIGNGSRVNIQFGLFNWEYKGKKGISADFQAIQVLDLVPYEGKGSDEFENEADNNDTTNTTTDSVNPDNDDDNDDF